MGKVESRSLPYQRQSAPTLRQQHEHYLFRRCHLLNQTEERLPRQIRRRTRLPYGRQCLRSGTGYHRYYCMHWLWLYSAPADAAGGVQSLSINQFNRAPTIPVVVELFDCVCVEENMSRKTRLMSGLATRSLLSSLVFFPFQPDVSPNADTSCQRVCAIRTE